MTSFKFRLSLATYSSALLASSFTTFPQFNSWWEMMCWPSIPPLQQYSLASTELFAVREPLAKLERDVQEQKSSMDMMRRNLLKINQTMHELIRSHEYGKSYFKIHWFQPNLHELSQLLAKALTNRTRYRKLILDDASQWIPNEKIKVWFYLKAFD